MSEDLVRKLPFSMMAEQSLLGCILIDPESFNTIAGMVKGTDFYIREHEQIFLAMQKLYTENN